MNILAGLYRPDAGEILRRRPAGRRSARRATRSRPGIGMVHQHFTLVPSQTVTENVLLGLRPAAVPAATCGASEPRSRRLAERFGLRVDPRARIWQLSVGEQQRVEILKMLYRGARILIMDEPTAVLAPQEVDELFATLRSMTAAGRERRVHQPQARRGARDRRPDHRHAPRPGDGRRAARRGRDEGRPRAADGRPDRSSRSSSGPTATPGEVVLASGTSRRRTTAACRRCAASSLEVRAGEIVGHRRRSRATARASSPRSSPGCDRARGEILVGGERRRQPVAARRRSDAASRHVPEDRTAVGSAPNLSLVDNLIMKRYREHAGGARLAHRRAAPRATVADGAARTRTRSRRRRSTRRSGCCPAATSSALILAREIETQPRLLIAVQPTRGLDVGADREGPPAAARPRRAAGAAILLISEELDEILALADRVDVMYEGRIVGSFPRRGRDRARSAC